MTITFAADGNARCLYTEAIDLACIGSLSIRRATNIEWDDDSQEWRVIHAASKEVMYRDRSRANCLDWEQENYQH